MGAVIVGEEDYSRLYDELPDDFIEEILAWLPAEYVSRFGNVCKQWKTLFSSTNFLRKQWAEAPPNKNPWLLLGLVVENLDFLVYSFYVGSWKNSRLSLCFLEGNEGAPPLFHYLGSCPGLFLIQCTNPNSIYVCNPLTAKYFILPPMADMDIFPIEEIGIVEVGEDGYKVLVVHFSAIHQQNIVVIYDSSDKAWTMAGILPRGWVTFQYMDGINFGTVFSGGYFYSIMLGGVNETNTGLIIGVMGFNMVEGSSTIVPLPDLDRRDTIFFSQLVACGSRILYVEGREIETRVEWHMEIVREEEVTIWEFVKDAVPKWKQIAIMPQTLHHIFNRIVPPSRPFKCAGMGDCLYFKKQTGQKVPVYNFNENSWNFLPDCPVAAVPEPVDPPLIAFKPRPDMKVE